MSKDQDGYNEYYDLDSYLFNKVTTNFHKNHKLTLEEFVCILIWKSNRSRGKIISKIKNRYPDRSLSKAVEELTKEIYEQNSHKERLCFLVGNRKIKETSIPLATSSAILTVLYPDYFTVYDIRVCNALGKYHHIGGRTFESLWRGYEEFRADVMKNAPGKTLRDKDKWLWGKSFIQDLRKDMKKW